MKGLLKKLHRSTEKWKAPSLELNILDKQSKLILSLQSSWELKIIFPNDYEHFLKFQLILYLVIITITAVMGFILQNSFSIKMEMLKQTPHNKGLSFTALIVLSDINATEPNACFENRVGMCSCSDFFQLQGGVWEEMNTRADQQAT